LSVEGCEYANQNTRGKYLALLENPFYSERDQLAIDFYCKSVRAVFLFLCLLVATRLRIGDLEEEREGGGAHCGRCVVVVVIVILLLFIVTQTNITLLQPHRDMANTVGTVGR